MSVCGFLFYYLPIGLVVVISLWLRHIFNWAIFAETKEEASKIPLYFILLAWGLSFVPILGFILACIGLILLGVVEFCKDKDDEDIQAYFLWNWKKTDTGWIFLV